MTSCYCYCYRFWGSLSLSRVLWISAYSRSNMKPKANPKQARKCIEELFCWFQVLRQQFIFLSFCIHFPSFSVMFLSFVLISFIFLSYVPFVLIPMCIHVLSSSFLLLLLLLLLFNLHACSFHFAFISFDFHSKVMEMALRLGQGTECNK